MTKESLSQMAKRGAILDCKEDVGYKQRGKQATEDSKTPKSPGLTQEDIDQCNKKPLEKFDPTGDSFKRCSARLQRDNESLAESNRLQ